MTADELARLELARRAFAATRPNEAEVSAGVRRARLALRRSKLPRKSWFGKGLVLVTLAIGGLAYAKPHGLGEIVARMEQAVGGFHPHGRFGSGVSETHRRAQQPSKQAPANRAQAEARVSATAAATPSVAEGSSAAMPSAGASSSNASNGHASPHAVIPAKRAEGTPAVAKAGISRDVAGIFGTSTSGRATGSGAPAAESVSSWGRVGQALAAGDEQGALSALNDLAASDDPRTRDKADLGRAQLLLAHGEQEQGCELARRLIHRRAGGRIERQALTLLESCPR